MLLQNELFLNVGTKDFPDGELRGHVATLPYSGHSARHDSECPGVCLSSRVPCPVTQM